jgi:hypothetical protein
VLISRAIMLQRLGSGRLSPFPTMTETTDAWQRDKLFIFRVTAIPVLICPGHQSLVASDGVLERSISARACEGHSILVLVVPDRESNPEAPT